jgi:pimeloyl-ACP methyl ester carboxylesterase
VLISPGGAGGDAAQLDTLMPRFDMQDRAAAAAFLRRIHARPPWYVPVIAGDVRRDFYRPPMQELVRQIRPEQLLRPEEVAGLRMPVLFVWGKHENLLLPEHRAFFLRHLPPHARVEEPDDFGHCPHLDAPHRVAELVNDFSRSILASSAG